MEKNFNFIPHQYYVYVILILSRHGKYEQRQAAHNNNNEEHFSVWGILHNLRIFMHERNLKHLNSVCVCVFVQSHMWRFLSFPQKSLALKKLSNFSLNFKNSLSLVFHFPSRSTFSTLTRLLLKNLMQIHFSLQSLIIRRELMLVGRRRTLVFYFPHP
jgi:hypothetical protein